MPVAKEASLQRHGVAKLCGWACFVNTLAQWNWFHFSRRIRQWVGFSFFLSVGRWDPMGPHHDIHGRKDILWKDHIDRSS